nr:MAG TPA: hypothetical protein [Caudoviricetes sp.]
MLSLLDRLQVSSCNQALRAATAALNQCSNSSRLICL